MAVVDPWSGRPERPDVDGWHWVDDRPRVWMAEYQMWAMAGFQDDTPPEIMVLNGHRYGGPCYTAADIAAAAQAERAAGAETMREAYDLIRMARNILTKAGLRDCGSDVRLSHEVRMFALHFSEEGRDGPGELQVRGIGRATEWLKAANAILVKDDTTALTAALAKARAEGMEAAAVWHEEQAAINATAGSPTSSANHSRYAAAIRAQIKQGGGAK